MGLRMFRLLLAAAAMVFVLRSTGGAPVAGATTGSTPNYSGDPETAENATATTELNHDDYADETNQVVSAKKGLAVAKNTRAGCKDGPDADTDKKSPETASTSAENVTTTSEIKREVSGGQNGPTTVELANTRSTSDEDATAGEKRPTTAEYGDTTVERSPTTEDDVEARSRTRRWTDMSEDTLHQHSDDLASRSKCPWTYRNNTDRDREPAVLLEAECSQTSVEGIAGQCEHIYYYVPVRSNSTGVWTDQWLPLSVGCTLASPQTIVAPPITWY